MVESVNVGGKNVIFRRMLVHGILKENKCFRIISQVKFNKKNNKKLNLK